MAERDLNELLLTLGVDDAGAICVYDAPSGGADPAAGGTPHTGAADSGDVEIAVTERERRALIDAGAEEVAAPAADADGAAAEIAASEIAAEARAAQDEDRPPYAAAPPRGRAEREGVGSAPEGTAYVGADARDPEAPDEDDPAARAEEPSVEELTGESEGSVTAARIEDEPIAKSLGGPPGRDRLESEPEELGARSLEHATESEASEEGDAEDLPPAEEERLDPQRRPPQ